jgi:hypothetical protein
MVICSSRGVRAFAAVFALGLSAASFAQPVFHNAKLSGASEVPANASTATGATVVSVNPGTGLVTWNTTSSIPVASVTGHHIHRAVAGVNGPVVVNFGGVYSGSVTITPLLAAEIVSNPTGFYVNLHTAAFPGGEIRGQLVQVPPTVPVLGLPLLILLGVALAGVGTFVFRRSKQV